MGRIRGRILRGDTGEGRFYGFLEAIHRPDETFKYLRMDIALDAVEANAFDDGNAALGSPEHLAIIRILSTQKRIFSLFGINVELEEGVWFEAQFARRSGYPIAWVLDADGGYERVPVRTNLIGLKRVFGAPTPRPDLDNELRAWCLVDAAGPPATKFIPSPIKIEPTQLHVRIVDVGHASCAAIHSSQDPDSKIIGYFDVGAPVFFHGKSFPEFFPDKVRVPSQGFVALSHWDFDHYSLAVTCAKGLTSLHWFAPDQPVGPNAARLQTILGRKLHFLKTRSYQIAPGLLLLKGQGAADDRNDGGYVLRVSRSGMNALLTGDVSYDSIPAQAKVNLSGLAITHHGGRGCSNPPRPASDGALAVVSYGVPNRYGHPSEKLLSVHGRIGWNVQRTAGSLPNQRGDVWLF